MLNKLDRPSIHHFPSTSTFCQKLQRILGSWRIMDTPQEDPVRSASGNLANALDHLAQLDDDDFLTGDDLTIAQIHSLSSKNEFLYTIIPAQLTKFPLLTSDQLSFFLTHPAAKSSAPIAPLTNQPSATSPLVAPSNGNGLPSDLLNTSLPSSSMDFDFDLPPRPSPSPAAPAVPPLSLPSPSASNNSGVSSARDGPMVSPLPKVNSAKGNSPNRKPSLESDVKPKPKRTSTVPRVAMLAKPAPKKPEESQRSGAAPFRSSGSGRGRTAGGPSTAGRGAPPGSSSFSRGGGGGGVSSVSRTSSRSSSASGASSSRPRTAATESTKVQRPAWGSPAANAAAAGRGSGAAGRGAGRGAARGGSTAAGRTGAGRDTGTPGSSQMTRRLSSSGSTSLRSTAASGAARGAVGASSSVSKPGAVSGTGIPRAPSGRSTGVGAGAAAAAGVATAAAVATRSAKPTSSENEPDALDTLQGIMGELKEMRHELGMSTPTAQAAEAAAAALDAAAEDGAPAAGEEEASSAPAAAGGAEEGDKTAEDGVEAGEVETKESMVEGEASAAPAEEQEGENDDASTAEGEVASPTSAGVEEEGESSVAAPAAEEPAAVAVEEEIAPVKVLPAEIDFIEEPKVRAKPLCSCSIM